MRYLQPYIAKDLKKKLVFLAGPRQVGKSTLAKSCLGSSSNYLNWDIAQDRKIIREASWPKEDGIVVLDELHKYIKWKNLLKGVIDQYQNVPALLVTGSARLETFRKGGDALTGRSYMYRLHPIDPIEAGLYFSIRDSLLASKILMKTGGFPEAFLNPNDADRLREDRLQIVVREDVRDLSMISELRGMQLLVELLRDRVGGTINFSNLALDIGVSPPTIKKWIELLERLYVIFIVYPYSRNLARSIRREPKIYFYDCAAASNGEGYKFENLVGSCLLKWIHFFNDSEGKRYQLQYFRDKDEHEVDFVITEGVHPKLLVEAKLSDTDLHSGLSYLHKRLPTTKAFQIVGQAEKKRQMDEIFVLGIKDISTVVGQLGIVPCPNPST